MKTTSLAILIFCYCNAILAQVNISGKVINAETKEAIPYVNIGLKNTAIGTVSDHEGNFQLTLNSQTDLVTFSAIGYEMIDISGDKLVKEKIVLLTPKNYDLQAIEITAQKFSGEDQILGVKNKKRGLSIGFGSRNLGTEIGALVPIKKPVFIKSANFVINHAPGDSLLFRVNIYHYKDGKIGEKILKNNTLINTEQKRGVISIDLTSLNLILKNDVLLSLEWIKDDQGQGNSEITFDTKKAKKLRGVYVKKASIGTFERMEFINKKLKPCFYFIGKEVID